MIQPVNNTMREIIAERSDVWTFIIQSGLVIATEIRLCARRE